MEVDIPARKPNWLGLKIFNAIIKTLINYFLKELREESEYRNGSVVVNFAFSTSFKIGITLSIFISSGTIPAAMELLMRSVKRGATMCICWIGQGWIYSVGSCTVSNFSVLEIKTNSSTVVGIKAND